MKKELLKHPAFVKFKSLKKEIDLIKSHSDELSLVYLIDTKEIQRVLVKWVCNKLTAIYLELSPKISVSEEIKEILNSSAPEDLPSSIILNFFMDYIPRTVDHWDLATLYDKLKTLIFWLYECDDSEYFLFFKVSDVLKKALDWALSIFKGLENKQFTQTYGLVLANVYTVGAKI
ncbi:hypothetical protein NW739_07045 [Mycoplasmopsis felis]|uniref:hypothetical protein n=1 Tax=Mycoplasmopsis felis TaxID=33923 RepID=UPI0021AEB8CE|nr:hypothetical protein [Mycoplasmopsis felis]MCU9934815.1 hypothetical protein [Mycoplasmopsis felis]MCU9939160.1 hypothetical protein [Mycoplasmopsis felis]MCU9940390.1 hypothetical protein [Mycoplasmopsis felis]UWV79318.1 hypothetical protein NW072_04645 [Mycoplasmopsis felis]UWV85385.1 hypothetical protein NW066_01515 [Mycoplasmopsis felis]